MLHFPWTCSCCGERFTELPLHWGVAAPASYEALTEDERRTRAELSADFCTIDGNLFFVRGVIEIPVIGAADAAKITYGAWVSLSPESMRTVRANWDSSSRAAHGPFFGWLNVIHPLYRDTLNLKTVVHLRDIPLIPSIELEPTDHPLALEQRLGVPIERAIYIAGALSAHR